MTSCLLHPNLPPWGSGWRHWLCGAAAAVGGRHCCYSPRESEPRLGYHTMLVATVEPLRLRNQAAQIRECPMTVLYNPPRIRSYLFICICIWSLPSCCRVVGLQHHDSNDGLSARRGDSIDRQLCLRRSWHRCPAIGWDRTRPIRR